MGVTILSVGGMSGYIDSNTCLHRTWTCRYYLTNEDERKQISMAGNRRCTVSGYSNRDRIKTILNEILVK